MLSVRLVLGLILVNICTCSTTKRDIKIVEIPTASNATTPRQIHISLSDDISKMVVTWSTVGWTNNSMVRYGSESLKNIHLGKTKALTNGPDHVQYIHWAEMDKLIPNTTYRYQVGSGKPGEMSSIFTFKTLPEGIAWSPRFCVYGDMGFQNAQSLPGIQADVARGIYDVILHVGDFAYDMDSNFGSVGDDFMNLIQPIAATVPYMTTPGNHERAGNFSNYKNRFRMPNNDNENMFYSYNVGRVHIVSMSTEFYIYLYYGTAQLHNQYRWLIDDLKTANLPQNRAKQPWIVFLGHRPIYCSNNASLDCSFIAKWIRYGVPHTHDLSIEELLYQYGVDIAIWGHQHSYERMWPVYAGNVVNSSTAGQPYKNPKATVHIVSGSAGCKERHAYFPIKEKSYSAFHSSDYGYSRMTVQNYTHLYLEQVSDDQKGKIIDSIWLIREHHGSFRPS